MSQSTISTFQLFEMFPDEETARKYLEDRLWPLGAICPQCNSGTRVIVRPNGFYRCNGCKKFTFSIRTGTIFGRSKIPLHKWCVALVLIAQRPEIQSELLAAEIGVTQKTAFRMLREVHLAAGDMLSTQLCLDDPAYRLLAKWSAYRVGADGSLWTRWRRGRGGRIGLEWREMNPTPDKDGYRTGRLYAGGGDWKQIRVAVTVCEAFHGPCPKGMECRHLDGINTHDAADNLAWGTPIQNHADKFIHGTQPLGDRHHNATLSDADVAAIRSLKGQRLQREVAAQFGTTQGYVSELWGSRAAKRKEVIA